MNLVFPLNDDLNIWSKYLVFLLNTNTHVTHSQVTLIELGGLQWELGGPQRELGGPQRELGAPQNGQFPVEHE